MAAWQQNLPPVSLSQVANLMLVLFILSVSLTPMENLPPVDTVDTGGAP
jgi:hypothetical protein